ncbi:exonuclease [Cellulophaga phage phi13:2]|uniref:Uncharacterized protein n=1 Tax=Cellulophaga phage phi13:2 TaxID=1328030 RepID=S0A4J7_9CAUD|nr:exonuclease [Cellulophaga phage phi13:2]AGO49710.1 hypothetical protein Phi13:2_gp100 [Cellulophaga phage phi13:2]
MKIRKKLYKEEAELLGLDPKPNMKNRNQAEYYIEEDDWDKILKIREGGIIDTKEKAKPKKNSLKQKEQRKGLESRGENVVINWSNRTIITDLGEYGNYVCGFDRHSLIQRKYVYSHGNETAAIVAMEFDFIHTKAVYIYARIHGFSKSSPGQTDLEFELGLDVDLAVEENIQTLKRRVYKKTQKREWEETVKAASNWWNFENTSLESIRAMISEFQIEKPEKVKIQKISDLDYAFSAIIGISDAHYLKLCYDHLGRVVYDREIAKKRIKDHIKSLANEVARYGNPENFFVFVGNDNIHVDGMHQSTTKLTGQHQATDGLWRLEFKNYLKLQIEIINFYKQLAKVVLIPVKGNHDYETSIAIQSFLEIYYEDDEDVEVVVCHDARAYYQYGKVCIVATHGDELGSVATLERESHKMILGEAKLQGINIQEVEHFLLIHGHEHVGSYRDLNGNVQRIGLPSLSGTDDWWHKEKGYVGRQPESNTIIVDPDKGRKSILYA